MCARPGVLPDSVHRGEWAACCESPFLLSPRAHAVHTQQDGGPAPELGRCCSRPHLVFRSSGGGLTLLGPVPCFPSFLCYSFFTFSVQTFILFLLLFVLGNKKLPDRVGCVSFLCSTLCPRPGCPAQESQPVLRTLSRRAERDAAAWAESVPCPSSVSPLCTMFRQTFSSHLSKHELRFQQLPLCFSLVAVFHTVLLGGVEE